MIQEFDPKDKVLVLDFDHTCYDTDAFLLFEIRQAMLERFNLPAKEWEEAYEAAVKRGYSLEVHRGELTRVLGYEPFTIEEIQDFEKRIDFSKYLYSDVIPVLKAAKDRGYKIMLLSFGDPVWQDKKVSGVGFDKIIDIIRYTKEEGNKAEVLKRYVSNCKKVIFVENNGQDLDAVFEIMPHIDLYFMNRVPVDINNKEDDEYLRIRYAESRRMAKKKTLHNHTICHSLEEVAL